jgi:RNA polymerase sigma-70 factor, ECF subfamily
MQALRRPIPSDTVYVAGVTALRSGRSRASPSSSAMSSLLMDTVMPEHPNFANCVAQHLPFLNRVVRSVLREDQGADDIVQQTVLKALTNAQQFRFESSLKTWLVSIAMNEARQVYRCAWHRRTVPLMTENIDLLGSPSLETSHNNYQANEQAALVHKAVSRLPKAYRCVIELCDFQQIPMKEAARQLGLTLAAVKSRRHRGRRKLLPLVQHLQHCQHALYTHVASLPSRQDANNASYVSAQADRSL